MDDEEYYYALRDPKCLWKQFMNGKVTRYDMDLIIYSNGIGFTIHDQERMDRFRDGEFKYYLDAVSEIIELLKDNDVHHFNYLSEEIQTYYRLKYN